MTSTRSPGPDAASPGGATVATEGETARRSTGGGGGPVTRTVHVILPATHRPLCGYEEEAPASSEGTTAVACPECLALLRSGLVARRARHRG